MITTTEHDAVVLTIEDRPYTYVCDMAALYRAERAMSDDEGRIVGSKEILYGSAIGSNRHTRFLLWGALQRHHPDVSLDDVTTLLSKLGGTEGLVLLLQKLRESTEPDPEDRPKARPRRARQLQANGTGGPATSSRVASGSTANGSGG